MRRVTIWLVPKSTTSCSGLRCRAGGGNRGLNRGVWRCWLDRWSYSTSVVAVMATVSQFFETGS
jgi:hypothetical protein